MDFRILRDSGITVMEFAKLMNVSRVTASAWINGRTNPHELREPAINKLLNDLQTLSHRGLLPMRPGAANRLDALKEMLATLV